MGDNIAKRVAAQSRECVHNHDKLGWLSLFADNGTIEDPIGKSYLDASGKGRRTAAEREQFWERNIDNSIITINIHPSYAAGNECANHVTLETVFKTDGKRFRQRINGIFTYCVDGDGKLVALRGYWEVDEAVKTITPLDAANDG